MARTPPATQAVVHLRGYGSRTAHLEVTRFARVAWAARVGRYAAGWLATSRVTLVVTFDPFVASFPFVIGLGFLYRAVRGRYRVHAFHSVCPSCDAPLELKPDSKIPLPYSLVCYACHHEPELRLVASTAQAGGASTWGMASP